MNHSPEVFPSSVSISNGEVAGDRSRQGVQEEAFRLFQQRASLYRREKDHSLSSEEFSALLDLDFTEKLQNNPPIEGVFSPKADLSRIKNLPKEQRKELIRVFRDMLARQREALASCRVFLERKIAFHHDVPKEELFGVIEKFGAAYGFDDTNREIIKCGVERYCEQRRRALEARQKFPDDYDLVFFLTGVRIGRDEKLYVSVGPMTIDIYVSGKAMGMLYYERADPIFDSGIRGFSGESSGECPVFFTVLNRDRGDDFEKKATIEHEYEHQKNRIFRELFEPFKKAISPYISLERVGLDFVVDCRNKKRGSEKRKYIETYLMPKREKALERVRDEMIAQYYTVPYAEFQFHVRNTFFASPSGDESSRRWYDYLYDIRNFRDLKNDDQYSEVVQKMLVDEYNGIIERAVMVFRNLKREGRHSTQETIALLSDVPLSRWPKTVGRLLASGGSAGKMLDKSQLGAKELGVSEATLERDPVPTRERWDESTAREALRGAASIEELLAVLGDTRFPYPIQGLMKSYERSDLLGDGKEGGYPGVFGRIMKRIKDPEKFQEENENVPLSALDSRLIRSVTNQEPYQLRDIVIKLTRDTLRYQV